MYLITQEIALLCVENENDSEDVASLKRSIIRSLDKRMPLTNSVQLETLLNPLTKHLCDLLHNENVDMLFKEVKDSATASNSSSDSIASVVDGENGAENEDEAIKQISKKRRI